MPFVRGDHDAIVCDGNRRYDHIERAARPAGGPPLRDNPPPLERGSLVESEDALPEQRLRSFRTDEPCLKRHAPPTRWQFQNAAPDFGDRQRRDEKIRGRPTSKPLGDRWSWVRFGGLTDDVCIK